MRGLTVEQRGDMAEALVPVAANLVGLVHGDGGPSDVQEVLAGLSAHEKDALLVVLAGLVDPDQPIGKALGWLEFTEGRDLTVPPWTEQRSVRDLVPEPVLEAEAIDPVAVRRYVQGSGVEVNDEERLAAIRELGAAGHSYSSIDDLRALKKGDTGKFVNMMKKQYERHGREWQVMPQNRQKMTPELVREIREQYALRAVPDLEMALRYGVSRTAMTELLSGRRYPDVGGPIRARRSGVSQTSKQVFKGGPVGMTAVGYNQTYL